MPEGTLIPLCLFLFFIATNTQSGWLYVLLAVLIGFLAVGWFGPRRTLRDLQVERQVSSGLAAGESATVRLKVSNPTRRPRYYVTVRDYMVANAAAEEHERWRLLPIDVLAPGASQEVEYAMPCPRRGVYPFASVWLESATPLGWFAATRMVTAPGSVVVFPRGPRLTRLPIHQAVPLTVVPLQVTHIAGQSHDFAGIREYQPGEDIRFIHWPSTARTGDLMVKEFLDQSSQNVCVLLDCDQQSREGLEEAVSAATGLCDAARHNNLALTLLASQGNEVKVVQHPRAEQHLYFLAAVQATATLSWEQLLKLALPHCASRSQLYILTTRRTLRPEHLTGVAGKRLHVSVMFLTGGRDASYDAACEALMQARVPTWRVARAARSAGAFAAMTGRPRFRFKPLPVENSVALRGWTLSVVLIGALAILNEEEWPGFGWAVLAITVFGYWLSYVRRGRPNWPLKIVVCFCMMWAMRQFFTDLLQSANDPRIPLANLLLWLQCLHAFDLPYRQNLNVSFFVGVVLMAVAAVMSTTTTFALFLLVFVVASLFMLQYSYLSWRNETVARQALAPSSDAVPTPPIPRVRVQVTGRILLTYTAGLALGTLVGYASLPHLTGLRIRTLPISVAQHLSHLGSGKIVNPAFPEGIDKNTQARGGKIFDQDNYQGFNNYLDLNIRGHLSNDVVMRVRTSRETYYRALAFNHYDGSSWQITDEDLQKTEAASPPVVIRSARGGDQLVQIFYLDKDMSNVIMGALAINQVYFPGDTLYVDRYSGVRADFAMEAGTTYSVISNVTAHVPSRLMKFIHYKPRDGHREPFLELPENLPERVVALARQLTAKTDRPYEKAAILCNFLRSTYPYTLDTPPYPGGSDATDYFLYTTKAGSCEQFATSMAVMCRAVGVPARLVVGYLPGNFNPFSGVYEVRAADAHAWVEVMIPNYGWMTFDPTPGNDSEPNIEKPDQNRWVLQTIWNYLQNKVTLPPWLQDWLTRLRDRIETTLSGPTGAILLSIGVAIPLGLLLRGRLPRLTLPTWRWTRRPVASPEEDDMRTEYHRMLGLLQRYGRAKPRHQTPGEYARRLQDDDVLQVTRLFEACRYGRQTVQEADVATVRQAIARLETRLKLDAEAARRRR